MANRDFLTTETRQDNARAIKQGVEQLTAAATTIKAVTQQLATLRTNVVSGVGSDYDQADVDKLDSLTARVSAFNAAAVTFSG